MRFTVSHGLPEAYRTAAADLYWQTFGVKLGKVMGPSLRAKTYLHRVMRLEHCIAVVQDEMLLGMVGLHGPDSTFAGGNAQDFSAVYGALRGLWRLCLLMLIAGKDADAGALMIDGFSVQASARGQGVGGALLKAVFAHARERGFAAVQLDVVGSNWRARNFYQRHGFTQHSTRKIGPLRLIFGFDVAVRMTRHL